VRLTTSFLRPPLTFERLRELLHYDPVTGKFTCLVQRRRRGGWFRVGDEAGYIHPESNRNVIGVDGRLYQAYRLAWLYMTGEWPAGAIDHKDCDSTNDSWNNLRLASPSQNAANSRRRSDNSTGYKGVWYDTRRRNYVSEIKRNYKSFRLGAFDTPEEAHAAYVAAATQLYGEFARAA
jgi:HNH endonuclease/AP2 domain-containing protein